jgi:hypothetical protein
MRPPFPASSTNAHVSEQITGNGKLNDGDEAISYLFWITLCGDCIQLFYQNKITLKILVFKMRKLYLDRIFTKKVAFNYKTIILFVFSAFTTNLKSSDCKRSF